MAADLMNYSRAIMDTIKSYVAIGAAVGGAYVYYNWDKLRPKVAAVVEAPVSGSSRDVSTAKSQAKKRKPVKSTAPQPKAAESVAQVPPPVDDDDAAVQENDKDWARQLQARQTGVSISGPASAKAAPSKKQNKAKQESSNGISTPRTAEPAATSSKTDGTSKAPVAGGVSDMLDAPKGPTSVLRITGEEKTKKQQPAKDVQAQETKKQRQNRRKVEEQKAQREADEKERQILLENQRRTAREARGEPAKNGMTTAAAPSSSVWTASQGSTDITATGNAPETAPLLDTFEQEVTPVAKKPSASKSASQSIPSEETQMQMLNVMEGNSGWNEVPKGKKAKGKATTGLQVSGNASNASSSVDLTNGVASAIQATTLPKKSQPVNNAPAPKKNSYTNGFAALEAATAYSSSAKGHPDDSDWAVA